MTSKTCTKCGQTFPATAEYFYRNSKGRNGLQSWCKACDAAHCRVYKGAHKAERAAYYESHKAEAAASARIYYEAHRAEIAAQHCDYIRGRRRANPQLRLNHSVSLAMWKGLHGRKAGRPWESLVGYTLADLTRHLESHFQAGMTFDNYGADGWVLDHVTPRSAFAFTSADDPQFRKCWALSNLQPMWGRDNIEKGNRESALLLIDQNGPTKPGQSGRVADRASLQG